MATRRRTPTADRQPHARRHRAPAAQPARAWKRPVVLLAALVAALLVPVAGLGAPRAVQAMESALRAYRVQPGDTLGAIASTIGSTPRELASLNGLANPDFIVAGQDLRLPAEGERPSPAAAGDSPPPETYDVRTGDTLGRIAARWGLSAQALARLNGLADPNRLAVGQRLRLAGAEPAGAQLAVARAAAAPAASADESTAALQRRLEAEVRRLGEGARVGLAARNLGTGARLTLRAQETFPSASVMKLPIVITLERQADAGTRPRPDATIRALEAAALIQSDNAAANTLYDLVSPDAVNDVMARLGLSGTRLVNRFSDTTRGGPSANRTTPADAALLLELLAADRAASPAASRSIRDLLLRNADGSKLARSLPDGARIAHKSGWYDGVANDVGIIYPERGDPWVLAVFAEGIPSAEAGNALLASLSRLVYDAWAR